MSCKCNKCNASDDAIKGLWWVWARKSAVASFVRELRKTLSLTALLLFTPLPCCKAPALCNLRWHRFWTFPLWTSLKSMYGGWSTCVALSLQTRPLTKLTLTATSLVSNPCTVCMTICKQHVFLCFFAQCFKHTNLLSWLLMTIHHIVIAFMRVADMCVPGVFSDKFLSFASSVWKQGLRNFYIWLRTEAQSQCS